MKDFLLVMFYQAIVAVNTAVILGSIIWLAKRKDEKDGRKPNPDLTPPPTRNSGGYQPKPCEMPKPPTTGSAAVKPNCGISADEAAKLFSKLAEASACLGGNSELDELQERVKDLADRLDRAEKKPVTPERLKEAGFETEKVRVFDPAEKRWTYREVVKNSKCSDCKHWKKETCSSVGKCEVLDRPTKWYERGCQLFEKWEPPIQTTNICKNCKHYLATDEEATTGLCGKMEEIVFADAGRACFEAREKPRTDHLCGDCCHFAASYVDEYEKPWGVCRKPRHYGADVGCGRWQEKPATLGTVTTH